jgi:MFS superfamily sulfate permease-like transporter
MMNVVIITTERIALKRVYRIQQWEFWLSIVCFIGVAVLGVIPDARLIPGLVLFRWVAPLFFANAEFFKERALDAVAQSPTPVRWLVVAAEPVTSVDVTAADILAELNEALHANHMELCFVELKDPVKDILKRFGLFTQLGERCFFPTVGAAVSKFLELHDVAWKQPADDDEIGG